MTTSGCGHAGNAHPRAKFRSAGEQGGETGRRRIEEGFTTKGTKTRRREEGRRE
jgi:hypothetical protein